VPVNLGNPFVGVGVSHTSGPVPDPGAYNNQEAYLRTDGTWANPGVDELRERFNNLIVYLLANGLDIPQDIF